MPLSKLRILNGQRNTMHFSINPYDLALKKAENQIDNIINKSVENGQIKQPQAQELTNSIMEYLVDPNAEQGNPFSRADANIDNMIQGAVQASADTRERMGTKPSMGLEAPEVTQAQQDLTVAEETEQDISSGVNKQKDICVSAEQEVDDKQDITNDTQSTVDTSQDNVDTSQATVNNNQNAVNSASSEVNTATSNVQNAQTTVTETSNSVTTAQQTLESAKNALSQAQNTAAQAQTSSSSEGETSSNTNSNNTAVQQAQAQVEQAQAELEKAQQKNKEAEQKLETEQATLDDKQNTLTNAQETLKTSQTTLKENQAELQTAQGDLDTAQNELKTSQKALRTENSNLAAQQTELNTATTCVTSAEQQVDKAEEATQKAKSTTGQDIAQNLWNDIHGIGTKDTFKEHINSITPDNVTDTISEYQRLSDKHSRIDKESLVEAICDEIGMNHADKSYSVHRITSCLDQKAKSLGMETNILKKDTQEAISKALTSIPSIFRYIKTDKIDEQVDKYMDLIDRGTKMNVAIDAKIKQGTIERYENTSGYDLLGNGKVDHDARQLAGNCWAHAAVNSYTSSERGQEIINNHVLTRNGVTAVYLTAADNNNCGENGYGIYTYNQDDLLYGAGFKKNTECSEPIQNDEVHEQSEGDGDVTAMMMAAEEYRRAIGHIQKEGNENLMYGGTGDAMYEIIEGKNSKLFGIGNIKGHDTLPEGIGYTNNSEMAYSDIREMIANGEGCATVSFKNNEDTDTNTYTQRKAEDSNAIMTNHAYSIMKMTDDTVYLEESNNPGYTIKISKRDFIKNVFAITTNKF